MIISKTPLRISFFGGGTDYTNWIKENDGGMVLSTTIDKFIYITARYLPPFFEHKSRIVWTFIELIKDRTEIKHPAIREVLKFMDINKGVEIHYDADLPSRTGLGSSSAFTVGLLNTISALKGKPVSEIQLAKDATYIEQEMMMENVGCQDQIAASFGGFNLIEFKSSGDFKVTPVSIPDGRLELLKKQFLLVFTGFSRTASEIAKGIIENTKNKQRELSSIQQMTTEALNILKNVNTDISEFGKLLNESWQLKKSLAKAITTPAIDGIYDTALKAGAVGGKLLGAGGGGFVLVFADPKKHDKIKESLKKYLIVPFEFEKLGTQIIFNNPETEYGIKGAENG